MAVLDNIATDLRWACRSVERRMGLLLALCGTLVALVAGRRLGLSGPVASQMPLFATLALAAIFHQWVALQMNIHGWALRLEERLGPGLGWGMLAASWSVPGGLRLLAWGKEKSKEAFLAQPPVAAAPAWPRSLRTCAWLVPLFLASCSAGVWTLSLGTGLASAAAALITGLESLKLSKAIRGPY